MQVERLKTAFFYALGNTVVANNLEQASRIAYRPDKQWSRVVTLQVRALPINAFASSARARALSIWQGINNMVTVASLAKY